MMAGDGHRDRMPGSVGFFEVGFEGDPINPAASAAIFSNASCMLRADMPACLLGCIQKITTEFAEADSLAD